MCEWCKTSDNRNHEMCQKAYELEQKPIPEAARIRSSAADQIPGEKIEQALIDIEDLMARIQAPFFVLGELSKQMYGNKKLEVNSVDVGVRRSELTADRLSTLKTLEPDVQITDKGFSYTYNGVPINVKFLDPESELYKRPDHVWYNAWEYNIPNPFGEYLKTI